MTGVGKVCDGFVDVVEIYQVEFLQLGINNRYIWNKMPSFQITLGAGTGTGTF